MASNFGIAVDKKSDGFGLKLAGDFDATSAYELIYAMKNLPEDTVKITIHTNGLKNIHPFGLDVFHRNMSPLDGQSRKIVFTGNRASQLSLGNSSLPSKGIFQAATQGQFTLAEIDETIQKLSGKAFCA